jgi:hypothetical protein
MKIRTENVRVPVSLPASRYRSPGGNWVLECLLEHGIAHGISQSSIASPGTRLNSPVLCVTSVQPLANAIAAI